MPETRCWVAQCLVGVLDQVKLLVVASGSIGVPIGSQSKICLFERWLVDQRPSANPKNCEGVLHDFLHAQQQRLGRKTFPARAVGNGMRIRDFKSTLLQVVTEIELGPTDKKSALRVDNHSDLVRFYEDVPVRRSVHKIHLILKPRTPAADH